MNLKTAPNGDVLLGYVVARKYNSPENGHKKTHVSGCCLTGTRGEENVRHLLRLPRTR